MDLSEKVNKNKINYSVFQFLCRYFVPNLLDSQEVRLTVLFRSTFQSLNIGILNIIGWALDEDPALFHFFFNHINFDLKKWVCLIIFQNCIQAFHFDLFHQIARVDVACSGPNSMSHTLRPQTDGVGCLIELSTAHCPGSQ